MPSNWTPEQVAAVVTAAGTVLAALAAVASAIFALIAVRAQRAGQRPHLTVRHTVGMPVFGMTGRSFAGSSLGDSWFGIVVHNDGLVPVTVRSVGVKFGDAGTAPFIHAPWPGADDLPKTLASGDEATFYLDELPKIAEAHAEHGDAKYVYARLGGDVEFQSEPIKKDWLDEWVPKRTSGAQLQHLGRPGARDDAGDED